MSSRPPRYLAVIGISLALSLAGCTSREEKAEQAAIRYGEYFRAQDYQQARLAMIEAVSIRDDVPAYWLGLGRVNMLVQDYGGAFDAFLRVTELDPTNIEALQNVSELMLGSGNLDRAEEFADKVLKIDPQDLRARLTKGYIEMRLKRYQEAERVADEILAIYPLEDAPLLLKASALFAMEKEQEAIDLVEKAIPLRGASPGKLNSLIEMYGKRGDQAGIERTYGRYVELQPEDAGVRLRFAQALYDSGKRAGAESILLPMLSSGQIPEAVADIMIQSGGDSPSAEILEQIGTGAPPEIAAACARIALEKGHPELTMQLMAPFIAGRMSQLVATTLSLFAGGLEAVGRNDEALRAAQRVLAFDEANPRALRVRAEASLGKGDLNQALTDARVLVRDQPLDVQNHLLLARISEARRDLQSAESTLRTAYNDMPGDERLLQGYVDFLKRRGKTREAAVLANDFTSKNNKSAKGWQLLADLCGSLGDVRCAERSRAMAARLEMAQAAPQEPA